MKTKTDEKHFINLQGLVMNETAMKEYYGERYNYQLETGMIQECRYDEKEECWVVD